MLKIKVGMMPGRLVEVVTNEGATAREIFEIANVELSNHEIRLDGEKIDLDRTIHNGNLLVAMKMIKGNMPSIKVGMMPGRLEVVEYTEGESAYEIFERANIGVSNHEVRLDGEKVALDTRISNGSLLVAMKMIKGNASFRKTDCTQEEVAILLGVKLPQVINTDSINMCGDNFLQIEVGNETLVVEEDMFLSVYNEIVDEFNGEEVVDIREVREEVVDVREIEVESKDSKAMDVLNKELEDLEKSYRFYIEEAHAINNKIMFLQRLIAEINA
jgi:hypothetical protein